MGLINHSGPHTKVRRGPFSHTRIARIFFYFLFFPQKLTTFLVVVTSKPTLNVQTF